MSVRIISATALEPKSDARNKFAHVAEWAELERAIRRLKAGKLVEFEPSRKTIEQFRDGKGKVDLKNVLMAFYQKLTRFKQEEGLKLDVSQSKGKIYIGKTNRRRARVTPKKVVRRSNVKTKAVVSADV